MNESLGPRARARRALMKRGAALGAMPGALVAATTARAQPARPEGAPVRLALLLGNRDYPADQELPPIPKNLRDLKAALEAKGFAVTDALNLDVSRSRAAIAAFARTVAAAPPEATVFFYYSGHGVQDEARNLLIAAGVNPGVVADVQKGSLELGQDVVGPLAPRAVGATYAVLDSCRVAIRAAVRDKDGLNQVEAPPGCLIAFSTGAGKPAISPDSENQNTFYTASLVKVLNSVGEETSFADMFRLVRRDVRETMLNHPVNAVRVLAQDPFIADNVQTHAPVLWRPRPAEAAVPAPSQQDEEELWAQIQQSIWPPELVKLASRYLELFPQGRRAQPAAVALEGATEAAKLLQRSDIKLYKSSFQPPASASAAIQRDFKRAARGDKDAAKRLGQAYLNGGADSSMDINKAEGRYEGWLQYATALGNGIASYDLALLYRVRQQADLAARYEQTARALGFTPPPSLVSGPKG